MANNTLFKAGDRVKVIDGPFQDFEGTVDEVNPATGKMRVLISIYGKDSPLNLDFQQVRLSP